MQKYYEGQVKKVRGIEAASSGSWPVVIDPP